MFDRTARLVATLAGKQRLSQSSQYGPRSAERRSRDAGPKAWEIEEPDSLAEFRIGDDGLPVNRPKKLWER
jgi:hypothetical protein